MSTKNSIVKELKNEFVKLGVNLGITILKEVSVSLDRFADRMQNCEVIPAETSKKEQ